jgi:hypothetical protein
MPALRPNTIAVSTALLTVPVRWEQIGVGRLTMTRLLAASIVLALGSMTIAHAQVRTIGYDRFMSLGESEQKRAFREADPGTKAMLKRVHAQRWLQRHRAELSARQITAVEKGISFLTPELYEASPAATFEREVEMAHALECALGRENVRAAFTFFPPEKQTVGQKVESFFYWLHACLIG